MGILAALPMIGGVIDKALDFIPDPAEAAKAKAAAQSQLLTALSAEDLGQAQTNTSEAGNASVFVAGWRPAVGWVCAAGLASQFLAGPLLTWGAGLFGHTLAYPSLDMGSLMTLLLGLLGLGGMRTLEKLQGVASGH